MSDELLDPQKSRNLFDVDSVRGMMIKAVIKSGSRALILFEDGSYSVIEAESDFDSDDVGIYSGLHVRPQWFGDAGLVACGLTTQEALDEAKAKKEKEERAREKANRRQRFEQLKREFEPEPPPPRICMGCGTETQGRVNYCVNCGELERQTLRPLDNRRLSQIGLNRGCPDFTKRPPKL